jgi:hypothetical protein
MSDKNEIQPAESQLEAPQGLTDDLRALYDSPGAIPFEIDRAVVDQARRHFDKNRFARHRQSRRVLRWAGAAAAVAAVLVVSFTIIQEKQPDEAPAFAMVQKTALNEDLDRSGRIDILDAFYLARRIEAADELAPQWDFDGDGAIGQADVDILARAAVRLRKDGL